MELDFERCWRATLSRDTRFDGQFYCAVRTTGIYCRPSCPGCPKRRNVRFYRSAAGAQEAGYRACKRCNPDASPGSPEWNVRADTAGRAMRLIADGVCDREGVGGLAARLGYTPRHLHRLLTAEVGVGPQALARAQRAQAARTLLETTPLPVTDVAMAAGFSSVRQFNATMTAVYDRTPTRLRELAGAAPGSEAGRAPGTVAVRLAAREPFDGHALLRHLAAHAVPGVEEVTATSLHRALALPHGTGTVTLTLTPGAGRAEAEFRLTDVRDLGTAIHRCRRLLDLDADPAAVTGLLAAEPLTAPLVAARPGLRAPGAVDPGELLLRTAVTDELPGPYGRAALAELTYRHGQPLPEASGPVTHLFPTAEVLARAPLTDVLPPGTARLLRTCAEGLASGELPVGDGAERSGTGWRLRRAGLSPRAVAYVALRCLKDPDAFPSPAPASLARRAERWRPWRSYALMHLWSDGRAQEGRAA